MRDYSERRQSRTVAAAAPKRPSVWPYVLLIVFLIIVAYLAGLGTGWYLFRPGGRLFKTPQVTQPVSPPKGPAAALPPQGAPIMPANMQQSPQSSQPPVQNPAQGQSASGGNAASPPLTFYDTLQKGNKGLMGTGINEPKEPPQHSPSKSPSTTPPEH